jgi:hypothetical protein
MAWLTTTIIFFSVQKWVYAFGRRLHGKHTGSFVLSEKSAAPKIPPLDEVEDGDYVAIHNRREFS